jgi:hypothetical protein
LTCEAYFTLYHSEIGDLNVPLLWHWELSFLLESNDILIGTI